jgi:hypothetical protein
MKFSPILRKIDNTSSLKWHGKKKSKLQMNGSGLGRKKDADI